MIFYFHPIWIQIIFSGQKITKNEFLTVFNLKKCAFQRFIYTLFHYQFQKFSKQKNNKKSFGNCRLSLEANHSLQKKMIIN